MRVKVLLIRPDLELVHDYLLKKKLTPIFLPNISWFQKNKAYGLVKKMSKYQGGFQKFKKDYQSFIENNYYIFRKPLDDEYIDV